MLTKEEIENLFLECKNKTDLIRKLNIKTNQNGSAVDNDLLIYLSQIGFTDRKSISKANFDYELNKRKEEKYLLNPKRCPICGKIIPWKIHNNICCSRSCAVTYSNINRGKRSEETKSKISIGLRNSMENGKFIPWNKGKVSLKVKDCINKRENLTNQYNEINKSYSKLLNNPNRMGYKIKEFNGKFENFIWIDLKFCLDHNLILNKDNYDYSEINIVNALGFKKHICPICGTIFYGRFWADNKISNGNCCSDKCKHELVSKNSKNSITKQIEAGTFQGWKPRNNRSYAEKFWINVLNNNNISFVSEYPIERKGTQNYFLDFYIEKNGKKINLEIDGKQHKYPDRKEQDKIRDEYLSNLGYIVYRIEWNKMSGKQEESNLTKEKIDKFLDFYNSL